MEKTSDFTQGKILGPLVRFALPLILCIVYMFATHGKKEKERV